MGRQWRARTVNEIKECRCLSHGASIPLSSISSFFIRISMPFDPTSQSNLGEVKTNHIHLALAVDFAAKTLTGTATLEVEAIADDVAKVVLDTSYVDVRSVSANGQKLNVIQCDQHEFCVVHCVYTS